MDKLAYTIEEVAQAVGVHPTTVRRLIKNGKLAAIRVGRQIRIPRQELEAFLDPVARALMDAPQDDEPVSREEDASAEEAWQAYLRGESKPLDEIQGLPNS